MSSKSRRSQPGDRSRAAEAMREVRRQAMRQEQRRGLYFALLTLLAVYVFASYFRYAVIAHPELTLGEVTRNALDVLLWK